MLYDRAYKVPFWVVVPAGSKKLIEMMIEEGAAARPLPSDFKTKLMTYKSKGYDIYLDRAMPYPMDSQLLLRAAIEHSQDHFGSTTIMNGPIRGFLAKVDMNVKDDSDFERLYNTVLEYEPDVVLSRLFKIGESVYEGNVRVFVSEAPANKNILTRLSGRVIEVGDESADVEVGKKTPKQVHKQVVDLIQKLKGENK